MDKLTVGKNFLISEEMENRLDKHADEEFTSQATIMRKALDEYLPESDE